MVAADADSRAELERAGCRRVAGGDSGAPGRHLVVGPAGERAGTSADAGASTGPARAAPGQPDLAALEAQAMQALARRGWKPDYLTVRQRADLMPPHGPLADQPLVVLGAAKLGNTRLIDNLEI